MSSILKGLNELSNDTLASYKKKAGADATASDKAGDYERGNKRFSGIVRATNKQFDNDTKASSNVQAKTDDKLRAYYAQRKAEKQGVTEGVNHPALQGWDEMDRVQKAEALVKAGITDSYYTLNKTPDQLDDMLHAARVKAQNQEDELSMGAGGRRELQRQAKQDFEEQRQQLHKEKMEMERFAWEKANTEAERKHEMAKIDKQYTQELRTLQMSHMQDMEKILHADTHELNKMKAEFNMRQAEREKVKPEPELPDEPEHNQGNNFDQDTGEPIKPNKPQQSNQWHTSQQLTAPTKPNKKNDDVTDVEPKPNKPLALGNSVKEAGPGVPFRGVGGAFNRGDDERHDLDTPKQQTEIWGLKINGKVWQKDGQYVTFPSREAALLRRNSLLRTNPNLEIGLVTQGGASPAPTKPAPQKPLMAVSLDKWKEAVLKRYPEARFMTQKMINGATIASDRSGQVGIYDPKNSYAKVGPETQQGVAEGSGGNWYIRVNGKILNDTKFKPVIFSSEDEARSHAMKLADKKRIPLSQMKLTKSWMDAPEQDVAEGSSSPDEYKRRLASIQSLRYDNPQEYAKQYRALLQAMPEEHSAHANQVQKGSYSPGERGSGTGSTGRVAEGSHSESDEELENFLDSTKPELDRLYKLAKTSKKAKAAYYELKEKWDAANSKLYGLDEQGVAEGLVKDIKRLATGKDVKSRAGQEIAKSQDASMKGDTKTSKKHFDRYDKLDKLANKEQGVAEEKQRLDPSCWKGYKKQGTKMKGDTRVNNCVPVKESSIMQGVKQLDEGWKEKLSAAALAGSMALGAAGASARVTPDGQGGFTGGLKPTATVTAPDNTPPATPPTSDTSDPFKGLARADSADRQAKTITVGGKEYGLVELSPTDIRPRGGQRIVVPQGVLGERGIGNYMGILAGDRVFVISK